MNREPIGTMTLPDRVQVGCDVHSVSNVIQSIEVFGDRYLERVFTTAERLECAGPRAAERLAGRFAAKEAVLKALRVPSDVAVPWPAIEVLSDAVGAPTVTLTGTAADFAAQQGLGHIELSLSHDNGVALAFAVAIPAASTAGEYAA